MISKVTKARIFLVAIIILFTAPFLSSWYLVFFTDFKKNDLGVQNGELIIPVVEIGPIETISIGGTEKQALIGKWTISGFVDGECENQCQEFLYKIRQIRLALGKNLDKVGRLIFSNHESILNFDTEFRGQHVVIDSSELERINQLFSGISDFDQNDIFLIDPYGFVMMRYKRDAEPKGIIKDIERLIKHSS